MTSNTNVDREYKQRADLYAHGNNADTFGTSGTDESPLDRSANGGITGPDFDRETDPSNRTVFQGEPTSSASLRGGSEKLAAKHVGLQDRGERRMLEETLEQDRTGPDSVRNKQGK